MRVFLLLALCCLASLMHSQQWVVSYPVEEGVVLVGGDCNENGNYIVGAYNKQTDSGYLDAFAMFVRNNGEYKEKRFVFEGYKSHLCSAICLENGNAFVVGVKGGTLSDHVYDTLWVLVMNQELETVEEHNYPLVSPYKTWTTDVYLELDNYGEVVILADVSERNYPFMTIGVYAVFKCDTHGNVLKSKYFSEGHGYGGARPTGIIKVPNSDNMMMLGKGFFVNNTHSICYIDNDLNKISAYPLPWMEDNWNHSDCWKDNGHFLMSSLTHHQGLGNWGYYAAVFEVDEMGRYVDTLVYDRVDTADYTAQFGSMAYVSDDAIFIATYWENEHEEQPSDAVMCLIDKDLNLNGTKRLKADDTKIRLMHCQKTSDGGCLVYGQCKQCNGSEMVRVWKLLPKDFAVSWSLDEQSEVLQHHKAYPNPTNNQLNIILDDIGENSCRVIVYDVKGRKCFERRLRNCTGLLKLDVSSFENGVYFYEIITGGDEKENGVFIKN